MQQCIIELQKSIALKKFEIIMQRIKERVQGMDNEDTFNSTKKNLLRVIDNVHNTEHYYFMQGDERIFLVEFELRLSSVFGYGDKINQSLKFR